MFEHLVVFRLREDVPDSKQQELLDRLLAFRGRIPGIVELSAGINVTEETENKHGFSIGLRITFESREALRAYGPHPVHQDFVRSLEGMLDQVIVVDYPI